MYRGIYVTLSIVIFFLIQHIFFKIFELRAYPVTLWISQNL